MQASRKKPEKLNLNDIKLTESEISSKISLIDLNLPTSNSQCEILDGEDDADSGRLLALKLRADKVI